MKPSDSEHSKTVPSPEQLGLTTLVSLVVAAMIGFGVFTSSGFALAALGNPGRVLLAWLLCGGWAIAGAVAYGALARRVPLSGGEYLYLSRLMHPSFGFLAGWVSLVAGFTAPIAAAAKSVVVYGFPGLEKGMAASSLATLIIAIACVCHGAKMGVGAFAQNAIVFIKLAFIACLLIWAFLLTPSAAWQGSALPNRDPAWWPGGIVGWYELLASMSWIALSYTGFNAAVYVAGESRSARKNVPKAMILATLLVTFIYLLLNVVFVLGPSSSEIVKDVSSMESIAATATRSLGGQAMESLTRAIIALALLSSVFGMLLAGPRVYAQMARDGVMPQFLRAESQLPRTAILIQAALSIAVVWLAQLDEIIRYLSMTLSACSSLAVAGVWRIAALSRSDPSVSQEPLKWFEHLLAAGYILGTLCMLAAVTVQDLNADFGRDRRMNELIAVAATFLVGMLVYGLWQLLQPQRDSQSP